MAPRLRPWPLLLGALCNSPTPPPTHPLAATCRARASRDAAAASAASTVGVLKNVEQADLIHYGLIPEFVGRFPVVCSLQARGAGCGVCEGWVCCWVWRVCGGSGVGGTVVWVWAVGWADRVLAGLLFVEQTQPD